MPQSPNKIEQFWQELKRRKVIKVIAMYAGVAYILIELASNVTEPLRLPEWVPTFVILLLVIGFPITIILSWIFDVTPEGIKKTESIDELSEQEPTTLPTKRGLKTSDVIISVLIVAVCILLYPKIFSTDKFEDIRDADGKISIVVLPFQNMTNDTLWNIYEIGIQNELITNLSNSAELSVRQFRTIHDILNQTEHTKYASLTPAIAGEISRKLEATSFIQGSIKSAGEEIRLNAHIIKSETEEIYKTFKIVGKAEDEIYNITDSLSRLLRNYLEIKVLEKGADYEFRKLAATNSVEAYRYYIQGMNMFVRSEYSSAIELFNEALEIDTNLFSAHFYQIIAYSNNGRIEEARISFQKIYKHIDNLAYTEQLYVKSLKSLYEKDPLALIKYNELLLELDPQARIVWYQQGLNYYNIQEYEKAIPCFEKALEIDKQWGGGWKWCSIYTFTGRVYHELENYEKEREIYELGLNTLPDDHRIIFRQAVCALSQGDTAEANDYIKKYRVIRKTEDLEGYRTNYNVGLIYFEAKQFGEAIDIFKELITSNPHEVDSKWQLGSILIENDIDVDEGMELIEQALEIEPDNAYFIDTKGRGLHKQGKNREALEHLNKAWDLRPYYDHDHFLHIQEVEHTLASQNN